MDRRVPKWKVNWCQENLKHMIGKDDFEMSVSLSKSKTLKSAQTLRKSKATKSAGGRRKTVAVGKKSAMMQDLATSLKSSLREEPTAAADQSDVFSNSGEGLE